MTSLMTFYEWFHNWIRIFPHRTRGHSCADVTKELTPFLEDCALTNTIQENVFDSANTPGVVVLLAPEDAGKTSRAIFCAQRNEHAQNTRVNKTNYYYQSLLDVSKNDYSSFTLGTIDMKSSVLILDNCDRIKNKTGFLDFCKRLGLELRVLVLTSEPATCELFQNNENSRIIVPPKWPMIDVVSFIARCEEHYQFYLPAEIKEKFIELALLAGTAGFIRYVFSKMLVQKKNNELKDLQEVLDDAKIDAEKSNEDWIACQKFQ